VPSRIAVVKSGVKITAVVKSSRVYTEATAHNPFEDLRAEMLARACANMTAAERRAAEAYVAAFWAQVVVQAVVKAVVKAVVRMQPTKSGALLTRMCLLGPGS
jgi:hypothetical protein